MLTLQAEEVPQRRVMGSSPHEITQLLRAWSHGDQSALDRLMPLVYSDLHRLAHSYMSAERSDHTLQATALVHEAYVRLMDSSRASFQDRAHFFAMCARLMRRILVDWARSRAAIKRQAGLQAVDLDLALEVSQEPAVDLVALDDALNTLATFDTRKSQVVELRFFGGLSVQEAAVALDISTDTVTRDWNMAKVWLRRELSGGAPLGV